MTPSVGAVQMAWEEFEAGGVRGISGDPPFDAVAGALTAIRKEYVERFGRNPYLAELMYTLLMTVEANPTAYVADGQLSPWSDITALFGLLARPELIDPGQYEGAADGESDDFLIFPRVIPAGVDVRSTMVLRCEVANGDGQVLCRYTLLQPAITSGMAESLIRQCVLQDLLDHDLLDDRLAIQFERVG